MKRLVEHDHNPEAKKTKTTVELVDEAWIRLNSGTNKGRRIGFYHKCFEAKLIKYPEISRVKLCVVTLKPFLPESSDVIHRLFQHFSATFSDVFDTCDFVATCYKGEYSRHIVFLKLHQLEMPENWHVIDSPESVIFHRGPLQVQLEIRGMDVLRGGTPSASQLQSWTGFLNIPGLHITVKELKEMIDATKDKEEAIFKEAALRDYSMHTFLYGNYHGIQPLVAFPQALDIVEMHCYEAMNTYRCSGPRWSSVVDSQVKDAVPEGCTDWDKNLKDFTNTCEGDICVRFVAYAVWGDAEPLM
jgi:hypothetical protein